MFDWPWGRATQLRLAPTIREALFCFVTTGAGRN
jgi:hypothetical protein